LVWKRDKLADGVENVLADTPGRKRIVLRCHRETIESIAAVMAGLVPAIHVVKRK
jgi:hypothetical protein